MSASGDGVVSGASRGAGIFVPKTFVLAIPGSRLLYDILRLYLSCFI